MRIHALLILGLCLAGCVAVDIPAEPSATTSPVAPTATVAFPTLRPTSTYTPLPSGTSAPEPSPNPGNTIYSDDFSEELSWVPAELAAGGLSLSNGRLVISVRQTNGSYMAISPADPRPNAFVEVDARAELCSANDEFGLAFRVDEDFDHYRFTLTCQGEARVVGVVDGIERVLVPNTNSTSIFPGLLLNNRLSIQLEGDQFRFFINGEEVFNDRDTGLASGRFGLIVRARQSGQTTASFDNFTLRELQPGATTTPSD